MVTAEKSTVLQSNILQEANPTFVCCSIFVRFRQLKKKKDKNIYLNSCFDFGHFLKIDAIIYFLIWAWLFSNKMYIAMSSNDGSLN